MLSVFYSIFFNAIGNQFLCSLRQRQFAISAGLTGNKSEFRQKSCFVYFTGKTFRPNYIPFFGCSIGVIITLIMRNWMATETAFLKAHFNTFAGSIIPLSSILTTNPVVTSTPAF